MPAALQKDPDSEERRREARAPVHCVVGAGVDVLRACCGVPHGGRWVSGSSACPSDCWHPPPPFPPTHTRAQPAERTLELSPRLDSARISSKFWIPVSSRHRPQNVPPPTLVPGRRRAGAGTESCQSPVRAGHASRPLSATQPRARPATCPRTRDPSVLSLAVHFHHAHATPDVHQKVGIQLCDREGGRGGPGKEWALALGKEAGWCIVLGEEDRPAGASCSQSTQVQSWP